MITAGSRYFFNQSVLPEFLEQSACFRTELFLIFYVRIHVLADILVAEAVDKVSSIADRFHDLDDFRRPDVETGDSLSVYFFARSILSQSHPAWI